MTFERLVVVARVLAVRFIFESVLLPAAAMFLETDVWNRLSYTSCCALSGDTERIGFSCMSMACFLRAFLEPSKD